MPQIDRFTIINAVLFQALWFSCVIGVGAQNLHALAVAALLVLAAAAYFSPVRKSDFITAGAGFAVGMIVDSIWAYTGILVYPGSQLAPYWIGFLWFGLGLTINHSMSWFRDRWLGSLIVGCFAPVTYLTGQRFGAVEVPDVILLSVIGLSWVGVFYMLSLLARRTAEAV